MTFDQIKTEVKERCNLTSSDADLRIGGAINRHYKRITSLLGMETLRATSVQLLMTIGQRDVVFTGIEKIDRLFDATSPSDVRLLEEISLHRIRTLTPTREAPQIWAMRLAGAESVTIQTDSYPQVPYLLLADGWTKRTDLTGSEQPAFPASFHDILTWFVLSEELLRKEKGQLALTYEQKAEALLNDLRFHLADTHTRELVQGSHPGGHPPGHGGGGDAGGGGFAGVDYTQVGKITFDRDPQAPFEVTAGSAKVANLDADLLDGETGAAFHDASKLTGVAPVGSIPGHRTTHETGGADPITALSATVLTSGTLPDARLSPNVQMKPIAAGDLPLHAARHQAGGADPVAVNALAGFPGGTLNYLRADGTFNVPPGAAGPHHTSHEPGGADQIVALDGSVITQGTVARARLPANLVDVSGTPLADALPVFSDADTLRASTMLRLIGEQTIANRTDGQVLVLCGGSANDVNKGALLNLWGIESGNGTLGLILGNHPGASFIINRGNAQQSFVIRGSDGLVILVDGQLQFPATQKPSADPTTLDDYREGTFAPIIMSDGGASGQVYSTQYGRYTKIGRLVVCEFAVILSVRGTLSGGGVQIGGFPFLATTPQGAVSFLRFDALVGNWAGLSLQLFNGANSGYLRGQSAFATGNGNVVPPTEITNTTGFHGVLTYHTAN